MSSLPDLSKILPRSAREQLKSFFLARLVEKGVNYRSEPMYRFEHALADVHDQSQWVKSIVSDVYDAALIDFDRDHPLKWSNEVQHAWRAGINEPEGLKP